jgi:hypothetical protein
MKLILLGLIHIYRMAISPFFPFSCRFYPTCSVYGHEVIEKYGAVRGGWLALKRILRCHPFCKGGFDPPPLT